VNESCLSSGLLLPRLTFVRIVREITLDLVPDLRYTTYALETLQISAEAFTSEVFQNAAKLANHAQRVTVYPKDIHLLRELNIIQ